MERENDTLIKRFLLYFAFVVVVGFMLCFPLELVGTSILQSAIDVAINPIIYWVGTNLMGMSEGFTSTIASDSPGVFVLFFILAVIALMIASVCTRFCRTESYKLKYWLTTTISYYLALVLLIYGANKLFKMQFYTPEPNTLFTPLGYLSKDILYWSVNGSSYWFNIIIGVVQILTALLLLFRRTRVVGASVAVVLFINIVIINFAYDISVKLFSTYLLCLSFFVAFPLVRVTYRVFFQKKKDVDLKQWFPSSHTPQTKWAQVVLKAVVIGVLIFESMYPYFATNTFNGDTTTKNILFGAYRSYTSKDVRRFFFHSRGYFIIQDDEDRMKDYKIIGVSYNEIKLRDKEHMYSLNYNLCNDTLFLDGELGTNLFSVKGVRIDLNKLPLLQRQFHLTLDDIGK